MSSIADLLGIPSALEFEGKSYKVRPPNQDEEGMFSRWLESRAKEFVVRAVDLGDERQHKAVRGIAADAAACLYEWGSDAYTAALGTPVGLSKMLSLILLSENPEIGQTAESLARKIVARKIAEIAAVLQAEALTDPKARAAVLAAVGLPPNYLDSNATSSSNSETRPSESPETKSAG
jgi:hypothetical protein